MAPGLTQPFSAIGTFSNGSTQDLTKSAVWASSQSSIATVDNQGTATARSVGSTTITATSGSVSGSAALAVTATAPVLVMVTITPAVSAIALGRSLQFTATGSYSDGSTLDLTQSATWNSSAPAVMSLSKTSLGSGVATAIGSTTISAAVNTVSASISLAVERAYWQTYADPTWDGPLTAIVSASNGDILVAANGTGVYRSSDGNTWAFAGAPAEPGIESLLWLGNSLYAGTHNGVFVSADEGASWTSAGTGLSTGSCAFALTQAFGYIYAATSQGIYRKTASASSWSPVLLNGYRFRALFVTGSGAMLAGTNALGNGGGPGGDIWRSTDGVTWINFGIANAWSFRAFGQDSSGTLYAGAFYKSFAPGGLYTSTDDGVTWTGPVLGTYSIQAITFHGGTVYLGTREGVLFSGPQTWTAVTNPSGKAILSLAYPFLGSDGIYRLDKSSHPALGSTPEITQVLQDGQGTTYWRSSYFGIWSSVDGYIGPDGIGAAWHLDDLMFLNAAGELIAFDENSIYHRVNGTWVLATFSGTRKPGRFYSRVILPDGSIIVGDVYAYLWKSTDGGSTFSYLTASPSGVIFSLFYSSNGLYAATELSNIIVSYDDGTTWNPLPVFVAGAHNQDTYTVTTTAAGTLLAGQDSGNGTGCIFRYVAGTWVRTDTGIGKWQGVYSLYSTAWGTYATTGSGVYESLDDGQTWNAMSGLPQFFLPVLAAEFRPIALNILPDGHLVVGVHWEGRGAYISAP